MVRKIAYLFPGQGAQYVGMGKDFYEAFPIAKNLWDLADSILGKKLSEMIFEGPSEALAQTENAQVAIFVTSFAMMRVLEENFPGIRPYYTLGLSLGEYTALAAAEKLSFEKTLLLVQKRAKYMQDACLKTDGGMQAVIGLEREKTQNLISNLQDLKDTDENEIWVANYNTPNQQVISGSKKALEKAEVLLKEKGAKRVISLDVIGAFHSPFMLSAQVALAKDLEKITFKEGRSRLVMNFPGRYVKHSDMIKTNLINQVTGSVLWEDEIRSIEEEVDLFIEIGCGKTLSGMNKKLGVIQPTISVEKVVDLDHVKEYLGRA